MHELYLDVVLAMATTLVQVEQLAATESPVAGKLEAKTIGHLLSYLKGIENWCIDLGLDLAAVKLKRCQEAVSASRLTWGELPAAMREIRERVEDELNR